MADSDDKSRLMEMSMSLKLVTVTMESLKIDEEENHWIESFENKIVMLSEGSI